MVFLFLSLPLTPRPPRGSRLHGRRRLGVRNSSRPFLAAISSDEKRLSTTISTEQVRPVASHASTSQVRLKLSGRRDALSNGTPLY